MFAKRLKTIEDLICTVGKYGSKELIASTVVIPDEIFRNQQMQTWKFSISATLDNGKKVRYNETYGSVFLFPESLIDTYQKTEREVNNYINNIFKEIKKELPYLKCSRKE